MWRRERGTNEQGKILSEWPISEPRNYVKLLNEPQTKAEEDALERSTEKNTPFGSDVWVSGIVKKYGLGQTLRSVGRPKKNGD